MLPLLPFEKIAKKNGIKRISREALEEAREIVDEFALEVAEKSVKLSIHAGRRTVKKDDVIFVAEHILKR